MNRRTFVAALMATTVVPARLRAQGFEVTRTPAEWRAMLSPLAYTVMRQEGTEPAYSSPLDKNFREGNYFCAGCGLALYPSRTKFDSGTGWPSFYASFDNAIGTKEDRKLWSVRTECHCRRCGSHLGHIFNDGPRPTGQRHCLNGVALMFQAA